MNEKIINFDVAKEKVKGLSATAFEVASSQLVRAKSNVVSRAKKQSEKIVGRALETGIVLTKKQLTLLEKVKKG